MEECELTVLTPDYIFSDYYTNLGIVDLSNNKLTDLPDVLAECVSIWKVSLNKNEF